MTFEKVLHESGNSQLLAYVAERDLDHERSENWVAQGTRLAVRVWDREALPADAAPEAAKRLRAQPRHAAGPSSAGIQHAFVDAAGRLVVVQDYVRGPSLRRSAGERRFHLAEVLSFGVEVLAALERLHRERCHLRVCPSTVRYSTYQMPRPASPVLVGLDLEEVVRAAGYPPWDSPWASPRQRAARRRPSPADDLYGVAALMYSMLVRELPPRSHRDWPRKVHPDVPEEFWGLLSTAMEPPRFNRSITARYLIDRINDVEDELFRYRTGVRYYNRVPTEPFEVTSAQPAWIQALPQPQQSPPVVRPAGDPPGGPFPRIGFR